MQESVVREIRMLRLTRRELETEPPGYRANSRPYLLTDGLEGDFLRLVELFDRRRTGGKIRFGS